MPPAVASATTSRDHRTKMGRLTSMSPPWTGNTRACTTAVSSYNPLLADRAILIPFLRGPWIPRYLSTGSVLRFLLEQHAEHALRNQRVDAADGQHHLARQRRPHRRRQVLAGLPEPVDLLQGPQGLHRRCWGRYRLLRHRRVPRHKGLGSQHRIRHSCKNLLYLLAPENTITKF